MSKLIETCRDCGENFEISDGEYKFFKDHGLMIPKRCKTCRALKKQRNEQKEGGRNDGKRDTV